VLLLFAVFEPVEADRFDFLDDPVVEVGGSISLAICCCFPLTNWLTEKVLP